MREHWLAILASLALLTGLPAAQEKGQPDPAKSPAAGETVVVEVSLATEHVPEGLKAGDRVDLKNVLSKTTGPRGLVYYNARTIAPDVEVVSVTRVEEPKDPEMAVKVELRMPKPQAERVETIKKRLVTVVLRIPGGGTETRQKPLTLLLELHKADKP
jgi:hypothetical protein